MLHFFILKKPLRQTLDRRNADTSKPGLHFTVVVQLKTLQAVPLVEAINPAARIHQLLFAGVKRMTFRTDIHLQFFFGGTGFKGFSASATHHTSLIIGVYVLFHFSHLSPKNNRR
jgi:hypothetical protein